MREPDFFIVGQTRSGTTSLQYQLQQHPDVFLIPKIYSGISTIFGFNPILKTKEEYLAQYAEAKNEKILGETQVDNLLCPTSASEIKQFFPNAKIIISLRNPIDVMYSVYSSNFFRGDFKEYDSFEKALEAEEKRKQENNRFPGKFNPYYFYRDIAKYTEQVKRYLDLFSAQKIHIIIFEDYINNTEQGFRKLCEFLEINPNFKPSFEHMNQIRSLRSESVQKIVNKVAGSKLKTKLSKIPKIQQAYWFLNSPNYSRPKIDPDLRKKLCIELEPEINELSKLLNMDLTYWYKN